MRACVLTATGGLDHLQITEVPDAPAPRAGEVRIAIRAAALNHLDLFVAEGMPGGADRFPHIVGSDDAKLAAARQLGADVTLNHKTQKISQEIRALTNKRGVDVVVENVGAATWDESLRCLRRGGRLVICGATSGPQVGLDIRRLFWHHWSILGSTMGNAAEYAEIVRRLGQGQLR